MGTLVKFALTMTKKENYLADQSSFGRDSYEIWSRAWGSRWSNQFGAILCENTNKGLGPANPRLNARLILVYPCVLGTSLVIPVIRKQWRKHAIPAVLPRKTSSIVARKQQLLQTARFSSIPRVHKRMTNAEKA